MSGRRPANAPIRLLAACRNAADFTLIKALLGAQADIRFEHRRVDDLTTLDQAARMLSRQADAVLVVAEDLDGDEEAALRRFALAAQGLPLILIAEFAQPDQIVRWAGIGIDTVMGRAALSPEALTNAIMFGIARSRRAATMGHDELTGLPLRTLWQDRLDHALQRCARDRTLAALMLIDVDDFKQVNDALGHDVGDAFLTEVAHRIRGSIRSRDTVARVGGDEFAVLLEDIAFPEAALRVARKIIRVTADPIILARASLKAAVSVGIAILGPDPEHLDPERAHRAADIALYDAKKLGKNRFSIFTADMDRALLESLELDNDLVTAVEREAFLLHYQPVVETMTGELEGFEALLRWERRPGEIIGPDQFLPALERLGLMDRIGRSLFARALGQLGTWRRRTGRPLAMHVNLSAAQIIDQNFSDMLLGLIAEADVPPSALTIELTETVAFKYGVLIDREFARLRRHGVRFAIDDFGTGYNSMTYLKQFRPDVVKIDRSFIATMNLSPVDAAIVRAQSVLAGSLGIAVVAEGVETLEQLAALRAVGDVGAIQGFLTGRPMAPADLERCYAPLRAMLENVAG